MVAQDPLFHAFGMKRVIAWQRDAVSLSNIFVAHRAFLHGQMRLAIARVVLLVSPFESTGLSGLGLSMTLFAVH